MLERRREATERDGCFDAGSARPNFTAARAVLLIVQRCGFRDCLSINMLYYVTEPKTQDSGKVSCRLWQFESCYDYEASTIRLPDSFVPTLCEVRVYAYTVTA